MIFFIWESSLTLLRTSSKHYFELTFSFFTHIFLVIVLLTKRVVRVMNMVKGKVVITNIEFVVILNVL